MKGLYVYGAVASFLSGIIIRSLFTPNPYILCALTAVTGIFVFFCRKNSYKIFPIILLSFFFLGSARWEIFLDFAHEKNLDSCDSLSLKFSALVVDQPLFTEKGQRIAVESRDAICFEKGVSFRLIATIDRYPEYMYGDVVEVAGILKKPSAFSSASGRVFNYPGYLSSQNIYSEIKRAKVFLIERPSTFSLIGTLYEFKDLIVETIKRTLPEPHSGLLAGILLGVKSDLGAELQDAFRRVGLVHIIVLSGSNVTIVAQAILTLTRRFPKIISIPLSIFAIICFALMTGNSATIIRASAMVSLSVVAGVARREYSIPRALVLVAFIVAFINPALVPYDPAFQLSFLATLGLVIFTDFFDRAFRRVPDFLAIKETLTASLATQIIITPFMMYLMGQVSLVSLLVNGIVVPMVPYVMMTGSIMVALSWVTNLFAPLLVAGTYFLLNVMITTADFFSRWDYAALTVKGWGMAETLAVYLCLTIAIGAYVVFRHQKENTACVVRCFSDYFVMKTILPHRYNFSRSRPN